MPAEGDETARNAAEQGSLGAAGEPQSQRGFLGSWLDPAAATSGAWSLWESVKKNPRVVEAQQHAQQVLQQYDADAVRARLAELGKSATEYIDEADRRLETLEVGAVNYLQQRSTQLVDKVRHAATAPEREGEVLFNGPERAPVSRLDAELQALHTAPDRLRAKTDAPPAKVSPGETQERLAQYPELAKLHDELAPELGEAEFWNRYYALRDELERQDRRRKMLIESQSEEMFEGWGSSDEEHDEAPSAAPSAAPDAAPDAARDTAQREQQPEVARDDSSSAKGETQRATNAKTAAPPAKPREPIDEEASDLDWE